MWRVIWPVLTIILFYFFALLQNSFFAYFSFFGAVPNFVFILFFLFVFFSKKKSYYEPIFWGAFAGFFLDIFSVNKIGVSVALLIIIGVLIKKIQSLLKEQEGNRNFIYFFVIFLASFLIYYLGLQTYFYYAEKYIFVNLNLKLLAEVLYNLAFGTAGYFIGKNFIKPEKNVW